MCLIIQRKPNFEIPYDKFETSILNNPDGYGLTYPDGGKLHVVKSSAKPDVDKLYRFIQEDLPDRDWETRS